MAICKHLISRNSSYGDVFDYFSFKHREDPKTGLYEPLLDSNGLMQERENYAIACLNPYGQNASPENWWLACLKCNRAFGKNRDHSDRKQHQYVISHPQEDRPLMTMEDLLEEGKAFVRENLPGYDALIAVHRDTPNDHIHICINSVRAAEREPQPWMMKNENGSIRKSEICAGGKHQDSPEFRRHYNDWLLNYTRVHGLTEKDNNTIAEMHKMERYGERNNSLATAIRNASLNSTSFPEFVNKLERQKIFLLQKGDSFCVLGHKNRNAVRLETLGIQKDEITFLSNELKQQEHLFQDQSKDFLIEKRMYIEWMQNRRIKNAAKAEDALADAASLITAKVGNAHSKEDFQELRSLTRQCIYLERDLQTELDKTEALLNQWTLFRDTSTSIQTHREKERFLRWCGCNPESEQEYHDLLIDREVINLQIEEIRSLQQALSDTSEQWRPYRDSLPCITDPITKHNQLSQRLSVIRANRKKLEQIAYNCQKAANHRIDKNAYLDKAKKFRKLWHDRLMEEKALKEELKRTEEEIKLVGDRGVRG